MKNIKKMFAGIMMGLALTIPLSAVIVSGNVVNAASSAASGTDSSDYILNIGSVSKMYVTAAVMQLVDQGKVELDAPVTDYIPDFKLADERYKDITVRMLMNHTSGLMGSSNT